MHAFTRIDSPELSRATAQRDEAASNERSVTRLPSSSARETKPCSSAACPSENPPLPATAGTDDEGGETKEDEGGAGEAFGEANAPVKASSQVHAQKRPRHQAQRLARAATSERPRQQEPEPLQSHHLQRGCHRRPCPRRRCHSSFSFSSCAAQHSGQRAHQQKRQWPGPP